MMDWFIVGIISANMVLWAGYVAIQFYFNRLILRRVAAVEQREWTQYIDEVLKDPYPGPGDP